MKKNIYTIPVKVGILICVFVFGISMHINAQIISTFAGNGTLGYSGDHFPATAAEMDPTGVTYDAAGNYYIADYGNHCIRKVSTAGIITTIAGTGGTSGFTGDGFPATAALLYDPVDVAIDRSGNIYFSDQGNSRIREINTSGIITTVAGGGSTTPTVSGIPAIGCAMIPAGLAFDTSGNLFIADAGHNKILKLNSSGMIMLVAGTGTGGFGGDGSPATAATLNGAPGIALDGFGNLYIADNLNHCIRKINPSGIISTCAGTPGTTGFSGDGFAATAAVLNNPNYVVCDIAGDIYFSDGFNNRIRKVNTANIISTLAGTGPALFYGEGVPASTAELSFPRGLCINKAGDIFLCDYSNSRVRVINFYDKVPYFIHGDSTGINVCKNAATSMDTLLAIDDTDIGQTEKWSLYVSPANGTATVSYTATSTGIKVTPTGLSYTPVTGYTGRDSFSVLILDGFKSDTITVHLTISTCPLGVSEKSLQANELRVWPNPNEGTFTVNLSSDMNEEAQIVVSNVMGVKLKEQLVTTNTSIEMKLDIPPGIYFLNVSTKHGRYATKITITQ